MDTNLSKFKNDDTMMELVYSWATLKCKRGNKQRMKHIINKETMTSLCGHFKPDLEQQKDLIYRKMQAIFYSNRCRPCIRIAGFLGINLERL